MKMDDVIAEEEEEDSMFRSLTFPRYFPRFRPTDQTRYIQATPRRITVINSDYSSAATPTNSGISCSISSSSTSSTIAPSSSSSLSRASINLSSSSSLDLRSNYRCTVRGREAIGFRRPNNIISPDKLTRHISAISTLRHANVVKIIGASVSEIKQPCSTVDLIYRFVDGPTLSDCLNPSTSSSKRKFKNPYRYVSSWKSRMEIALGVARGLAYLHHMTGFDDVVFVHNRIKSSNIILTSTTRGDSRLIRPMICNFGLSALEHGRRPNLREDEEGYSYMAPELVQQGEIAATQKSDVYAFGVLLLELIYSTGISKNYQTKIRQMTKFALADELRLADEFGMGGSLLEEDMRFINLESPISELLCVTLACVVKDPALRPDMAFLEGIILQSVTKFEKVYSIPGNNDGVKNLMNKGVKNLINNGVKNLIGSIT